MLAPARADLYWNPGGAPNGVGTWDAGSTNWNNASDGSGSQVTWDSSTAVFSAGTGYTDAFTVTLSGAQSAAGVTFEEGTVTLGGSDLNLTGGALVDAIANGSIGSIITGNNGLTKTGVGTVTLTNAANSFTGTVAVNGGILSILSDGHLGNVANTVSIDGGTLRLTGPLGTSALPWLRNISLGASGGTINSSAGAATFHNGVISGPGGLSKTGTVSFVLGANNTYSGATTIADGALISVGINSLGDNSATNSVILNGGTLRFDASYDETRDMNLTASSQLNSNGATIVNTVSGDITGGATFNLTKSGTGTIVLSGSNNYAGNTMVSAGRLIADNTGALPGYNTAGRVSTTAAAGVIAASAGGVGQWNSTQINDLAANATIIANGRFGINVDTGNTFTHTGLAGPFFFVKLGNGELVLGGSNTYTGTTEVTQGTLKVTANNQLPDTPLTVNGGTLDLDGNSNTNKLVIVSAGGTLTGGTINNSLASGTGYNLQAGTVNAVMAGTVNLTKTTAGVATVTSANTYTGTSAISAGTLLVNNTTGNGLGGGNVTVSGTGIVGGTGTITSPLVTVSAGARLSPGDPAVNGGTGTLTVGALTLSGLGLLDFDFDTPGTSDLLVANGNLTLANAGVNITAGGGFGLGTYDLIDYSGTLTGAANLLYVNSGPNFKYTFNNDATNTKIQLVVAAADPTQAGATWNVNAAGNWDTGSNWTGNAAPQGIDAVANFGSVITAARTITLDGAAKTVGTVNFDNANRYTLSGNAPVVFDVSTGNAALNVISGSHTWNPPTQLNDPTTFNIPSGSSLTIGDVISSGNGSVLTKSGGGTMVITAAGARPSAQVSVTDGILFGTASVLTGANVLQANGGTIEFSTAGGAYNSVIAGTVNTSKVVHGGTYNNASTNFSSSSSTAAHTFNGGLYTYMTWHTLSGGGSVANASLVDVFNGRLILNNATNNTNRINNSASVTLRGAEFQFIGHATALSSETIGDLKPSPGGMSYLTITPGTGGAAVTAASLTPSGGVLLVRGAGLGTNTGSFSQFKITGAPATGVAIPGLIASDNVLDTGATATLATHTADGVRMMNAGEYDTTTTPAANSNYAPGANATLPAGITLGAIEFGGASNVAPTGGATVNLNSSTVTVTSGMVLSHTTSNSTITSGTLAFGNAAGAGQASIGVYDTARTLTVSSAISSTGLTKFGNGVLSLNGSNNLHGGVVSVQQGILTVNNVNRINSAGSVDVGVGATGTDGTGGATNADGFRAGLLRLNSTSGIYTPPLTMRGPYTSGSFAPGTDTWFGGLDNSAGNNTWSGDITLMGTQLNTGNQYYNMFSARAGTSLTLSGVIQQTARPDGSTFNAGLFFTGKGDIVLTGTSPNTYREFMRPAGARIIIEKDGALGVPTAGETLGLLMTQGTGGGGSASTVAFRAPASSPAGFNYTLGRPLQLAGQGVGLDGVLLQNLGGANTFSGPVTIMSNYTDPTYNEQTVRVDIAAGSLELSGVLSSRNNGNNKRALVKEGAGQLVFSGDSSVTPTIGVPLVASSPVDIKAGGITITGADGRMSNAFDSFNVRLGANLTLDNSRGVNTSRINSSAPINLSGLGAELKLIGHATDPAVQSVNTLSIASFSTVTVSSPGGATELALPSSSRSNRGTVLFRGMDANAKVSLASSTLRGDSSNAGTLKKILPEAVGDTSASGSGTDFVTVSGTFVQPLTGADYIGLTSGNSTLNNTTASGTTNIGADTTVNSIKLNGGSTVSIAAGKSLYAFSGAILGVGTASSTITGGKLAFHQYHNAGDPNTLSEGAYTANPFDGPSAGVSNAVNPASAAEAIITVPTGSTLVQETGNVIAASKGLTKSGGGTLRLKGDNTFGFTDGAASYWYFHGDLNDPSATQVTETVSPLTINAGRLEFDTDNNLGYSGSPININGGTLAPLASSVSARNVSLASIGDNIIDVGTGGDFTITGKVSGNALTKNGPGILELTEATNDYAGTIINAGYVRLDTATPQQPGLAGSITLSGGSLMATEDMTLDRTVFSNSTNNTGGFWIAPGKTLTFGANESSTAAMTGSGNYAIDGGGTLILAKSNGAQMSYIGRLIVNAGSTLTFEANAADNSVAGFGGTSGGAIVDPQQWVVLNDNSRLRFNVTSSTGTFFSGSNRGITVNAGGGKIDVTSGNIVANFSGIFGTGTLTKEGAGEYRVRVSNPSFSGKWNISEGILEIGQATNSVLTLGTYTGADLVTIQDGATLKHTTTGLGVGTFAANQGITFAGTNHTIQTVNGTILTVNSDITAGAGKNLIKTEGGRLNIKNYRGGDVTVSGGTLGIIANGGNDGTSKFTQLSTAAAAKVDLTNNKMVLTNMDSTGGNAGAGAWNGTAYDGVTAMVIAGQGTKTLGVPQWDGTTGIMTSSASTSNLVTTIAVARAGDVGKTTHGGQAVDADDTLLMYTYGGDANLSGNVDADDYFAIDSHYGLSGDANIKFAHGDFNYDGVINGDDFNVIDAGFTGQGAPIAAGMGVIESFGSMAPGLDGVSAVPEPGSFAVLSLAAMSCLGRRRRK